MTAPETTLLNRLQTVLPAAGLKDGNIPVRNFIPSLRDTNIPMHQIPCIQYDIIATGNTATAAYDLEAGIVSVRFICWVESSSDFTESADRARNLRESLQNYIFTNKVANIVNIIRCDTRYLREAELYWTTSATGAGLTMTGNWMILHS